MPGTAAGWVARRLPVADDDHRDELAASLASVVEDRPRCDRAWEVAGLVGLWLRLWGRREGGDDARRALRQGVHLGGVVLMLAVSGAAWSRVAHVSGGGTAETAALVAGAALASAAAALDAGGWRMAGVAAASASLLAGAVGPAGAPSGGGDAAPNAAAVGAVGAIAVLAMLAGDRFGGRRCGRGLAAGALGAGVLAAAASLAPPDALVAGAAVALAVVPLAFLGVGWFDPRFAVAATTVWLALLAAIAGPTWSDFAGHRGWPGQLSGWWVLVAAVLAAALVSRAAMRRSFGV